MTTLTFQDAQHTGSARGGGADARNSALRATRIDGIDPMAS